MRMNQVGSLRISSTESSTLYSAPGTASTPGAYANDAALGVVLPVLAWASQGRNHADLQERVYRSAEQANETTCRKRESMKIDLNGRIAVITGGSRGLGEAMAKALASANAQIALVARDRPRMERVRDEIAALGKVA